MIEPLSASRIQCWLKCSLKFKFRYILRLTPAWKSAALGFGSAVHSACQAFHEERINGRSPSARSIVDVFRADWAAQQIDDLRFKDGDDAETLGKLGETLIGAYVAANADLRVIGAEVEFLVPLIDPISGEVIEVQGQPLSLRGFFDALLEGDVILELKTAARNYDHGTLARHLQLTAYHYAYYQAYGQQPLIRVDALLKTRRPRVETHSITRTLEDAAWFVHLAAEVARSIESQAYPPNPGWSCTDCEFNEHCRAWRGGSDSEVLTNDHRPQSKEGHYVGVIP